MILQGACWTSPYFAAVSEQGESVPVLSVSRAVLANGGWRYFRFATKHVVWLLLMQNDQLRNVEDIWGQLLDGPVLWFIHLEGSHHVHVAPLLDWGRLVHIPCISATIAAPPWRTLGGSELGQQVVKSWTKWCWERSQNGYDGPTAHHSTVVSQGESLLIVCTLPTTFTWPGKGSRSVKKFPCKCGLVRRMPWQQPTMFWWLSSSESRGGDFRWPSQWGPVPRMEFKLGLDGWQPKVVHDSREREREREIPAAHMQVERATQMPSNLRFCGDWVITWVRPLDLHDIIIERWKVF